MFTSRTLRRRRVLRLYAHTLTLHLLWHRHQDRTGSDLFCNNSYRFRCNSTDSIYFSIECDFGVVCSGLPRECFLLLQHYRLPRYGMLPLIAMMLPALPLPLPLPHSMYWHNCCVHAIVRGLTWRGYPNWTYAVEIQRSSDHLVRRTLFARHKSRCVVCVTQSYVHVISRVTSISSLRLAFSRCMIVNVRSPRSVLWRHSSCFPV